MLVARHDETPGDRESIDIPAALLSHQLEIFLVLSVYGKPGHILCTGVVRSRDPSKYELTLYLFSLRPPSLAAASAFD